MNYDKYKSSGIEWIGNVPTHWRNYRVDWISAFVRGNTGFKKDELLNNGEYVALQYGKTYKVDEVNNTFNFFVNNEFYKYSQVVHRGDTILISTSETIEDLGHTCFYNRVELGLIGGEQILIKPKSKHINGKYLYYYSKFFSSELKKYATGLKVFRFNIDDLKNIFISIPLLEEQTAIAEYLDTKTQAIDKKINLLSKKADYYKELRKSIINDAVCKGLDKNVKMKESELGVQIAFHFEIKRLKDICKIINGYAFKSNEYLDFGLPVIRIGDINFNIDFEKVAFVSEEYRLLAKESKIKKGDILMAMTGATIGKNSFYNTDKEAYLNQRVCSFRVNRNIETKFLGHFISSMFFQDFVQLICGGSAQENISKAQLEIFKIIIPPKEEQIAIANYLDEKTQKIDAIVSNIGKQIEILKELRKTLINDVVTGRIKVSEL